MKNTCVKTLCIMQTIVCAAVLLCFGHPVAHAIEVEEPDEVLVLQEDALVVEQQDYVASGVWGTCRWTLDEFGELLVYPGEGASQEGATQSPWNTYYRSAHVVRFVQQGGKKATLRGSAEYLFANMVGITSVDMSGLDTSQVTDMSRMFSGCSSLANLDISTLQTSCVANMSGMFYGCSSLAQLDVSSFDTSHVITMSEMFTSCLSLMSLDVSGLNTACVQDMSYMFQRCYKLRQLDLRGFNTAALTNMQCMFSNCTDLASIDLNGLDTSRVTNMDYLLRGCSSIVAVDVTGFNTQSVRSMRGMFNGCTRLYSVYLNDWNTSSLTNIYGMFFGCSSLVSLGIDDWDTSHITNMDYVFGNCTMLEAVDFSRWDTRKVTTAVGMFEGCGELKTFCVGDNYVFARASMIPNATSDRGTWWSTNDGTWYTKEQIARERNGIADVYTAYRADRSTNIKDATVTLDRQTYAWSGLQVTPVPTVIMDGFLLKNGRDFSLRYKNNVEVGTATVVITGMGSYAGSQTITFQIAYNNVFKDVSEKTSHVKEVMWLAVNNISTGFSDGTFRPNAPVARADMAAFLFRLARKWGLVDDSWMYYVADVWYFSDVDINTPHVREIRWMLNKEITKGWGHEDGTAEFRPYAPVARQDMAAFIFRLAKLAGIANASDEWEADEDARQRFVDVDGQSASNHHEEVWWLAQNGISQGWKTGSGYEYRGLQPVARQDMAAFLQRLDSLMV